MPRRWLLSRDDPRTVVAVSAVVLAVGILAATLGTGIPGPFMAVWLVASAGQLVHAVVRLRRSVNHDDVPDTAPPSQSRW